MNTATSQKRRAMMKLLVELFARLFIVLGKFAAKVDDRMEELEGKSNGK